MKKVMFRYAVVFIAMYSISYVWHIAYKDKLDALEILTSSLIALVVVYLFDFLKKRYKK